MSERIQPGELSAPLAGSVAGSLQMLDAILSASPSHVYLYDSNGRYLYANTAALDALQLRPADIIGKSWRELGFPAGIMEQFEHRLRAVFESGRSLTDVTVFPVMGEIRDYEYHLSPVKSSNGETTSVVATVTDVTAQRRATAETQLLLSITQSVAEAADFHEALSLIVSGIARHIGWPCGSAWAVGPATGRLECCKAWYDATGTLNGFREATALQTFAPEEGVQGRAYSTREPVWIADLATAGRDDGSAAAAPENGIHAAFAFPILSRGQVEAVITLYLLDVKPRDDATLDLVSAVARQVGIAIERKYAEEEIRRLNLELDRRISELQSANKELEAFSYSVSHDLRAPLRAIDGYSQMLEEDFGQRLNEDAARYIRTIRDSAREMGELVDDLLSFSRLSRQAMTIQEIDVAALVGEVLKEFKDETAGRDVVFKLGDLPTCSADRALLKRVYVNLLSNALKYSRRRPRALIEIGSIRDNPSSPATYFVKDNGVGFDMRYSEKPFGVFQRLHKAEEYEGTGVGLAIVQRVVTRHGGKVWAESKVDGGATFYFTIEGVQGDAAVK
ncbi:MAG: PAS domain S-box protein [SAR202 cluster bacterium]|nr:PAS domain S-box protein [SAR202 cluster bacterium]